MNKNEQVLALCGETKVDNKAQSWVTMIQVFEYYTNVSLFYVHQAPYSGLIYLTSCLNLFVASHEEGI